MDATRGVDGVELRQDAQLHALAQFGRRPGLRRELADQDLAGTHAVVGLAGEGNRSQRERGQKLAK